MSRFMASTTHDMAAATSGKPDSAELNSHAHPRRDGSVVSGPPGRGRAHSDGHRTGLGEARSRGRRHRTASRGRARSQAADGALRVHRVLPRGRFPQTLSDPTATRRAAARLAGGRFDVLVAHCSTSAHGLLAARLDVPLVYVFHADAAMEARFLRTNTGLGARWLAAVAFEGRLRRMTTRAVHASAQVIVLSEFSRGLLSRISTEVAKGAVLARGVSTRTSSHLRTGRRRVRASG